MMLSTRTLGAAVRGSLAFVHFPRAGFVHSIRRFSFHSFSTSADKIICQCGEELPKTEEILDLFKNRNVRMVTQLCNCRQLRSYNFTQRKNCELSKELNKISALILPSFDDVVYRADQTFVMLESLKTPPQGDFGDLTGDHGKQVSIFLKHCLQKKLISSVGSVLDVGGQNTSTVELISQVLNKPSLPSLIIDLSSVTPAITPSRPNIKYAIGDACRFFSSEKYQAFVSDIITDAPSLVLFNNILNVLNATDGWATLQVAWSRLRTGDYLFISGLVPEQLEKHRMKKFHEIDGIVEFRYKDRFYKSALSPDFADFVEVRLKNVSVLIKETFKQTVEIKLPQLTEEVHGYRLLALRKA